MQKTQDALSWYESRLSHNSISIISIPSELGSDARGLAAAPDYLLNAGLEEKLTAFGACVGRQEIVCPQPRGLELDSRAKNMAEVVAVAQRSCEAVAKDAHAGTFVIALGGDNSISIGTVSGAAQAHRPLGLIWIDAHPDANTDETTLTGNIHGMPATALMGFGNPALANVGARGAKIAPEHFLYLGLKDLDQAEIDFIRREKIAAVTMREVARGALAPVFSAIDMLRQKVDRIWVTLDVDSVDERDAPGVAMNSPGGFTRREIVAIANYIGKTCPLAGMDIVEMLPAKDIEGKTARVVLEVISNLLGCNDGSYYEYMERYEKAGNMGEILLPSPRARV